MKTETATRAKTQFGRMLDDAVHEPVIIKKSGRNVAVIISFEEYKRMIEIEDRYWLQKARASHKKGFIGTDAGEKLLDDMLDVKD